jgi:hypothetical protein
MPGCLAASMPASQPRRETGLDARWSYYPPNRRLCSSMSGLGGFARTLPKSNARSAFDKCPKQKDPQPSEARWEPCPDLSRTMYMHGASVPLNGRRGARREDSVLLVAGSACRFAAATTHESWRPSYLFLLWRPGNSNCSSTLNAPP